ncbi:hypothetical protein WL38_20305 [Burkholderia ubonensis]|uniref:hypothetical protein n=1 Tax=Burkholderia ubonensis TaxID=101571 RepID=UPI000757CEB3|nr:hypothetical protein [Burkholderia ubonensis]KWB64160.1 hypothetical protein WL38_20305 [Burkholderia ubonensis]
MMALEVLTFDHGRWHYELIEALGCSRSLRRFCADEDAVRTYLHGSGRPQRVDDEGRLTGVDDATVLEFLRPIKEDIDTAIGAYKRQLIVVITAITEAATNEAFRVLFTYSPHVMNDLTKEGQEFRELGLSVSLDSLINATDLSSLRAGVVDRAVSAATQGKKRSVLRRLERLLKGKLPDGKRDSYLDLVDRRNSIVHENWRGDVSDDDLEKCFDAGLHFVEEIGRMLVENSLPVADPMRVFEAAASRASKG